MSFCRKCGNPLLENSKFCNKCGTQVIRSPKSNNNIQNTTPYGEVIVRADSPHYYEGEEKNFSISDGMSVHFNPEVDSHVYYKRCFSNLAKDMCTQFAHAYAQYVTDLDSFIVHMPKLYYLYREPMINAVVSVLIEAEVFSVSNKQVEEEINEENIRANRLYTPVINAFNNALENNQQKVRNTYNMLPNLFFAGLGGILLGTAINFAANEIAESSLRSANVTAYQRKYIFSNINHKLLIKGVFYDYLDVYIVLVNKLNANFKYVWYPLSDPNSDGIYTNLLNNNIPQDKTLSACLSLINSNPVNPAYVNILEKIHGNESGVKELVDYLKMDVFDR